jgi:hypothetical protein
MDSSSRRDARELVVSVSSEASLAAALTRDRDETRHIARGMGVVTVILAVVLAALAVAASR